MNSSFPKRTRANQWIFETNVDKTEEEAKSKVKEWRERLLSLFRIFYKS